MIKIKVIASSSRGNAYLIDDGVSPLLLECGVSWREIQKALDFKTWNIQGCLISHSHGDHSKSVKDVMKNGIDCYMRQETANELSISDHCRVDILLPGACNYISGWDVVSFPTIHDCPGLGFYMVNKSGESLLYATDTAYLSNRFADLNYIMIECNYSLDILNQNVSSGRVPVELKNRLLKTHFSLENVIKFLKANDLSKVQEIHLLHLSALNSDEVLFKRKIQKVTGCPVYVAKE